MTGVAEFVDVEALAVAWLTAAAVAGGNVSTELPPDVDDELPWLQLWRLPGTVLTPETQHLERARLQLASWGATKADALDAILAACVAIAAAVGSHDEGTVTAVDVDVSPYWSPDPDTDTPRYFAAVALTVHPG